MAIPYISASHSEGLHFAYIPDEDKTAEVFVIGKWVIWLEEGKIRMDGGPAEVTGAYLDDTKRRSQNASSPAA